MELPGDREFAFEFESRRFMTSATGTGDSAGLTEARAMTLAKLRPRRGVPFRYRCEAGDGLEHDVVLEALDWESDGASAFACTDGAMACPCDDGDADLDPKAFSPAAVTRVLRLLGSAGVLGEHA